MLKSTLSLTLLITTALVLSSCGGGGTSSGGHTPNPPLPTKPTASVLPETLSVMVGQSATQTVTLTLPAAAGSTGILPASLSNQTDFYLVSNKDSCIGDFSGGQSCTIQVMFEPKSTGAKTVTLDIPYAQSSTEVHLKVTLNDTATPSTKLTFNTPAQINLVALPSQPGVTTLSVVSDSGDRTFANPMVTFNSNGKIAFSIDTAHSSCKSGAAMVPHQACTIMVNYHANASLKIGDQATVSTLFTLHYLEGSEAKTKVNSGKYSAHNYSLLTVASGCGPIEGGGAIWNYSPVSLKSLGSLPLYSVGDEDNDNLASQGGNQVYDLHTRLEAAQVESIVIGTQTGPSYSVPVPEFSFPYATAGFNPSNLTHELFISADAEDAGTPTLRIYNANTGAAIGSVSITTTATGDTYPLAVQDNYTIGGFERLFVGSTELKTIQVFDLNTNKAIALSIPAFPNNSVTKQTWLGDLAIYNNVLYALLIPNGGKEPPTSSIFELNLAKISSGWQQVALKDSAKMTQLGSAPRLAVLPDLSATDKTEVGFYLNYRNPTDGDIHLLYEPPASSSNSSKDIILPQQGSCTPQNGDVLAFQ